MEGGKAHSLLADVSPDTSAQKPQTVSTAAAAKSAGVSGELVLEMVRRTAGNTSAP